MHLWFNNEPQAESFVGTKLAGERSPTLGSLQVFLSFAHHADFKAVAAELQIDATTAARHIEKLEDWLHRILVWKGTPVEVNADVADEFILAAIYILESMEIFCIDNLDSNSSFWKIRFYELIDFSLILKSIKCDPKSATYKKLRPTDPGTSEKSVRDLVKKIELAFGVRKRHRFISGWSLLKLTDVGETFSQELDRALTLLNSFRADVLEPHSKARDFLKILDRIYLNASIDVSVLSRRRMIKSTKMRMEQATVVRDQADVARKKLREQIGIKSKNCVTDIDIDKIITENKDI